MFRLALSGWLVFAITAGAVAAGQTMVVRVEDANRTPIAGARVSLEANKGTSEAFSSPLGLAEIALPGSGSLRLVVEKETYYAARPEPRAYAPQTEVVVTLERVSEHAEALEVSAPAATAALDSTSVRQGLDSRDLVNIPYPNTNDFRSALRAVPGMVRGQRGGLHLNGAAEEQVLYTLNGFTLNDPLTGRFESRLSVESVQSVEVSTGNLPAEYGKGSAGALAVRSHQGDDRWRPMLTNFVPGVEHRKGWLIGDWQPRLGVAGPLRRGRAWLSTNTDLMYLQTVIRDLPKGADRYTGLRWNNLTTLRVNLTPANVFSASLLTNAWTSARTGLSALDPRETTVDRRTRQWFLSARDQIYFGNRTLVEFGYGGNRTFAREIPQGPEMLSLTPQGKRGNYYLDAVRQAARDQALVNVYLPSFTWRGAHQVKLGGDAHRLAYDQDARRSGFDYWSRDGFVVRRAVFVGSGQLGVNNVETAWYAQDAWRPRAGLLLDLGVRADWDRLVGSWNAAPRVGVAWSPRGWENTKLYAGVSRLYDATPMRLFARPQDQPALVTYFTPAGVVLRGPAWRWFEPAAGALARPGAWNWNAGLAQAWNNGLSLRADWSRRRGGHGLAYQSVADVVAADVDAVFRLAGDRRDRFDAVTVTVRQALRRQYEWALSYTRSRTDSSAAIDLAADEPLMVANNTGPLAWDAPHRFTGWAYLPLPRRDWAVAAFLDTRSGFPYSVQNELGAVVGQVNAQRFPRFFELNVHVERRFTLRAHRWALRAGCNNITGRVNPDTVNTMLLPAQFFGGSGRAVNLRIRWLGRL